MFSIRSSAWVCRISSEGTVGPLTIVELVRAEGRVIAVGWVMRRWVGGRVRDRAAGLRRVLSGRGLAVGTTLLGGGRGCVEVSEGRAMERAAALLQRGGVR